MNSPVLTMNMADLGSQSFSLSRGNLGYASSWTRLKDFANQAISKENEISSQLRQLERLSVEIDVYGESRFESKATTLMNELASNPAELAKAMNQLAMEPTEKLKQFNKYYYAIQKNLYDCLAMSMMALYTEDDYLFQVMLQLQNVARSKRIYVAPSFIDEVQKNMLNLLDAQIRELAADAVDLSREEAEKRIRRPFLMKFLGDGYLAGISRKRLVKWRRNEVFGSRSITDQISSDLSYGKIDAMTLSMITKQLQIMLDADKEIRKLAHATVVLLDITRKMAADVAKNLEKFHAIFGREPGVETMYGWLKEMENWSYSHGRIIMDRQRANTDSLLSRVKKMRASLPSHFTYLKQLTKLN